MSTVPQDPLQAIFDDLKRHRAETLYHVRSWTGEAKLPWGTGTDTFQFEGVLKSLTALEVVELASSYDVKILKNSDMSSGAPFTIWLDVLGRKHSHR